MQHRKDLFRHYENSPQRLCFVARRLFLSGFVQLFLQVAFALAVEPGFVFVDAVLFRDGAPVENIPTEHAQLHQALEAQAEEKKEYQEGSYHGTNVSAFKTDKNVFYQERR